MTSEDSGDDGLPIADEDKERLNSNLVVFNEDLYVDDILDTLIKERCITRNQKDTITANGIRQDQVSCLIEVVRRHSARNYKIFRESLKQWYPHLYNLLLPDTDEERDSKHQRMSEEKRDRITQCAEDISDLLSVDYITRYLQKENVLSKHMVDLMRARNVDREKAQVFCDRIVTRGDSAYDKFLESLKVHNDPKNNHLKLWERISKVTIPDEERHKFVGTKLFQDYCQERKNYMKRNSDMKKRQKLYPNLKMAKHVDRDSVTIIDVEPETLFKTFEENCDSSNTKNNPKRIVLKGPAGIGKTTLMEKMESDWRNGKLWANRFVAIFPIKLRKYLQTGKEGLDLCSMLLNFNGPTIDGEAKKKEIMDSICCNAEKILIIFDGLDEAKKVIAKFDSKPVGVNDVNMALSFESLVYSMGIKDLLPDAYILFTTRPFAPKPDNVLSGACIDVEGFDSKKITKYIKLFAASQYPNKEKKQKTFGKDVNKVKEKQPVAESLCYYPLFCHYICELVVLGFRQNKETATFTRVLLEILVLFIKYGEEKRSESGQDGFEIIAREKPTYKKLCKVAKRGIETSSLVFTEECLRKMEIEKTDVDAFLDSGLWKENLQLIESDEEDSDDNEDEGDISEQVSSEDSDDDDDDVDDDDDDDDDEVDYGDHGLFKRTTKTYEFIHAIFQEFWSACAFAVDTKSSPEGWIQNVKEVIGVHQYDMVLTFLIGLLNDEQCQKFVKSIEAVDEGKHHSRADEVYSWVLSMLFDEKIHIEKSNKRLKLLTLYQESQQCPPRDHWEYICPEGIFILYQVKLNPKELSAVQYFMERVGSQIPVTKMIFEKNFLSSKTADFISKIVESVPGLKSLKVPNNELGKEGLEKICETVKGSKCLEKLELCSNKLMDELAPLVKTIHTLSSLQYLGLSSNGITEEGAEKVVSALEQARKNGDLPNFTKLDIAYNHIVEGDTMDRLEQRLKQIDIIVYRMGMHHKPTPRKAEETSKTILRTQHSIHQSLEECMPEEGREGMFFMNKRKLKSNEMNATKVMTGHEDVTKIEFEKLSVESGCDIADFISSVLERVPNLKSLKLPDNNIGKEGLKRICQSLNKCHLLEKIELRTNCFKDDIEPLLDIIPTLTSLQYLGLSSTGITDKGAKKFVSAVENAKNNDQLKNLTKLDIAYNHVVEKNTLDLLEGLNKFGILVLKMGMNRR